LTGHRRRSDPDANADYGYRQSKSDNKLDGHPHKLRFKMAKRQTGDQLDLSISPLGIIGHWFPATDDSICFINAITMVLVSDCKVQSHIFAYSNREKVQIGSSACVASPRFT
jgi:hypothetical protein